MSFRFSEGKFQQMQISFPTVAERSTAKLSKLFLLTLLLSAFPPTAEAQPAEDSSEEPKRQLVQMFVERFNYASETSPQGSAHNTDILMRELGRQSFSLALADEMNVPVRDEALSEFAFYPKGDVDLEKLAVLVRSNVDGNLIVRLYQADLSDDELWQFWDKEKPLRPTGPTEV